MGTHVRTEENINYLTKKKDRTHPGHIPDRVRKTCPDTFRIHVADAFFLLQVFRRCSSLAFARKYIRRKQLIKSQKLRAEAMCSETYIWECLLAKLLNAASCTSVRTLQNIIVCLLSLLSCRSYIIVSDFNLPN